jgi:hypothetical protein
VTGIIILLVLCFGIFVLVKAVGGKTRHQAATSPTTPATAPRNESSTQFLQRLLPPNALRQLDIPTVSGNAFHRRILASIMDDYGGAPKPGNLRLAEDFGLRMHYPDHDVVLVYAWGGPAPFLWRHSRDGNKEHGLLFPIGPLGARGRINSTRQGEATLFFPGDDDPPESFMEAIRVFDQDRLHAAFERLMTLPLYASAQAADGELVPGELGEFLAHLASARFVTLLDEGQYERMHDLLDDADDATADGHDRPPRLYGDGTLVEIADGLAVDSRGRLQTEIVDGLTVRSDGKYAVALGKGLSVDSDGVIATSLGKDVVIHTDGRLTTRLFGFDITIGEEKPKKKGFLGL